MPQSLAKNIVHIIFSTKGRKATLPVEVRTDLYVYIAEILKRLDCVPHNIGGTEDHIHILCEISKNVALSAIVQKIKAGSSNWMKKTKQHNNFYWQHGYGVFSVSLSAKNIVANYINNQMIHHQKISFIDEFKLFLDKHKIFYDEKYLWD